MEMLIRSLARNETSISPITVLVKDIAESTDEEELLVSRNTVTDYLDVLDRLHLIENQNSFMYKIRSKANVGKIQKDILLTHHLGVRHLTLLQKN